MYCGRYLYVRVHQYVTYISMHHLLTSTSLTIMSEGTAASKLFSALGIFTEIFHVTFYVLQ